MKEILFYLFVMSLAFIIACKEESNPAKVGTEPMIEEITMQYKWNSTSILFNKIEVKVTDPQGFSNIYGVFMEVVNSSNSQVIFSDSLYDDGAYYHSQDGDVFAGDGIFSNKFSSVQILSGAGDGNYEFSFQAFDKDNHQSSTLEKSALFGPNARPEIVSISATDTLKSGTPGQIIEMAFSDGDGFEDVIRGYFETKNDSNQVIDIANLYNDGDLSNHGDLFANDSIFSIKLDSSFAVDKLGIYTFNFHVEDSFNEENIIIPVHQIFIENLPGRILSTSVPDSIEKPTTPGNTVPFELNAFVTDPQGLMDVNSVYFLSEKPDGTFSGNGYHFELFDDGDQENNGDDNANDGEYSLIIQIAESNDLGVYKFHFYMRDHVGHLTNVVKDSILVY